MGYLDVLLVGAVLFLCLMYFLFGDGPDKDERDSSSGSRSRQIRRDRGPEHHWLARQSGHQPRQQGGRQSSRQAQRQGSGRSGGGRSAREEEWQPPDPRELYRRRMRGRAQQARDEEAEEPARPRRWDEPEVARSPGPRTRPRITPGGLKRRILHMEVLRLPVALRRKPGDRRQLDPRQLR